MHDRVMAELLAALEGKPVSPSGASFTRGPPVQATQPLLQDNRGDVPTHDINFSDAMPTISADNSLAQSTQLLSRRYHPNIRSHAEFPTPSSTTRAPPGNMASSHGAGLGEAPLFHTGSVQIGGILPIDSSLRHRSYSPIAANQLASSRFQQNLFVGQRNAFPESSRCPSSRPRPTNMTDTLQIPPHLLANGFSRPSVPKNIPAKQNNTMYSQKLSSYPEPTPTPGLNSSAPFQGSSPSNQRNSEYTVSPEVQGIVCQFSHFAIATLEKYMGVGSLRENEKRGLQYDLHQYVKLWSARKLHIRHIFGLVCNYVRNICPQTSRLNFESEFHSWSTSNAEDAVFTAINEESEVRRVQDVSPRQTKYTHIDHGEQAKTSLPSSKRCRLLNGEVRHSGTMNESQLNPLPQKSSQNLGTIEAVLQAVNSPWERVRSNATDRHPCGDRLDEMKFPNANTPRKAQSGKIPVLHEEVFPKEIWKVHDACVSHSASRKNHCATQNAKGSQTVAHRMISNSAAVTKSEKGPPEKLKQLHSSVGLKHSSPFQPKSSFSSAGENFQLTPKPPVPPRLTTAVNKTFSDSRVAQKKKCSGSKTHHPKPFKCSILPNKERPTSITKFAAGLDFEQKAKGISNTPKAGKNRRRNNLFRSQKGKKYSSEKTSGKISGKSESKRVALHDKDYSKAKHRGQKSSQAIDSPRNNIDLAGSGSQAKNWGFTDRNLDITEDIINLENEIESLCQGAEGSVEENKEDDKYNEGLPLASKPLRAKMIAAAKRHNLRKNISKDAMELVSLAVLERLRGIFESLKEALSIRSDAARASWPFDVTKESTRQKLQRMVEDEERSLDAQERVRSKKGKEMADNTTRIVSKSIQIGGAQDNLKNAVSQSHRKARIAHERSCSDNRNQHKALLNVLAGIQKKRKKAIAQKPVYGSKTLLPLIARTGQSQNQSLILPSLTKGKGSSQPVLSQIAGSTIQPQAPPYVGRPKTMSRCTSFIETDVGGRSTTKGGLLLRDCLFLMESERISRKSCILYKWYARLGA